MKTNIYDCSIVNLKKTNNSIGNTIQADSLVDIPFDIKRVYYIYDVPGGETRGGHAHKQGGYQLITAVSGSFKVILDDGKNRKTVKLNNSKRGLILVPGLWREMVDFSSGAVCLVLASYNYDEMDYIRDYQKFLLYKKND